MQDAYYSPPVVQTAVDLANTLKPIKGKDALESVEQLRDFLDDHPAVWSARPTMAQNTCSRHPTRADLAEVRTLRQTVREVLERSRAEPAAVAELINNGLRRSRATPVLRHQDDHWWIEVASSPNRLSAHLAAATLGALASVIATLGPARLGVCARPTCRATFVDLSRNGSKQYCTRTCAHWASVAAYRSRHSAR